MTLLYHPLFKEDLNQAVEFYNAQIDGLGDELRKETEETFAELFELRSSSDSLTPMFDELVSTDSNGMQFATSSRKTEPSLS